MTLTQHECDRIRAEEIERLQVRKEFKRQRRPKMLLLMIVWMAILIGLVELSRFH
jgi:hypothetical protein